MPFQELESRSGSGHSLPRGSFATAAVMPESRSSSSLLQRMEAVANNLMADKSSIVRPSSTSHPRAYPCPNAFLDLGTNRGDSILKFLEPENHGGVLASFFKEMKWNPKEFCVFGFEGNPHFNATLEELEHKHAHEAKLLKIFRQTVVVAEDGPVTFYLDTVNPGAHFWGSSVLEHHVDVEKSGKVKIIAKGINLGKFVEEHVDPKGVVMVKMDIEGAEYQLMRELISSGRLCKKDEQGNNLFDYMNIEFHPFDIVNPPDGITPSKEEAASVYKWILHKCGIKYNPSTD